MALWKRLAPAAALALLITGFYWKLAFTGEYLWFDSPDMANIELPRLNFQARAIHAGEFPLWIPHSWAGQPLIGQTQPGPLYPFNLLFCLLAFRDGALSFPAVNWYYIFIRFLAALFCYWCAREYGRSQGAAVAAGVAFACSGFLASCGWIDVANSAIWIPLVFLFLHRSVKGERPLASAAACGFFAGFAFLAGHHEIPILTFWAAVAFWAVALVRDRKLANSFAVFLTVFLLAGAAQTLPSMEYARLAVRWTGLELPQTWKEAIPYTVIERYSMPWTALVGLVMPRKGWHDPSVYAGVAALFFAAAGLVAMRRERGVRWMGALAAGSFLFALGANAPFHGLLFETLPMIGKTRVPLRALSLFSFALAMLFAFGVDAARGAKLPRLVRWAALSLTLVALAEWSSIQAFPRRGAPGVGEFLGDLFRHADVAAFLRSEPQPSRALVNDSDVAANINEWYGFDAATAMGASVTWNFFIHEIHKPRVQDLFAVTHYVGREPQRPEQQLVFTSGAGLRVFRNPGAMARARIVHETESVPTEGILRSRLAEESFDMRTTALFLGAKPPELERCRGSETAVITDRSSNEVRVRAKAACRGLLVLGETHFPGWMAWVDGEPAPVHAAYGVFRSVVLPPGEHEVVFRYRPWTVYAGFAASVVALALTLTLAFVRRPSQRGAAPAVR